VVLGLPRGGVPVAYEVARALGAPLDVIVVRKLRSPAQPELALGAIGEADVRILNERVIERSGVDREALARLEDDERAELARRAHRLRQEQPRSSLEGRTTVVVDDGIATGATARAACEVARAQGARHVILAAPIASPRTLIALDAVADEVVCLESPDWFRAVAQGYDLFDQTSEREVTDLLRAARERR
jgi:putative phosphoribosyl transferase